MLDLYHKAYLREKKARVESERILESKNQSLYSAKQELIELTAQLMGHNRELIKSEKLAALGRLSAGVAHEIKNPLAYVKSNISLLEDTFTQQQAMLAEVVALSDEFFPIDLKNKISQSQSDEEQFELRDLIFDIYKGLSRIDEISSTLTGYSHKEKEQPSLVDVNDVLADAIKILYRQDEENDKIKFEVNSLPLVHGVEGQFSQIFLNLISNGFYAVKNVDNGLLKITTFFSDGGITVRIKDNGHGMDSATLDRAFDPFFTTKAVGEGTGLGLYIAYSTVEKIGGSIKVKSSLNDGTEFKIFIPINSDNTL